MRPKKPGFSSFFFLAFAFSLEAFISALARATLFDALSASLAALRETPFLGSAAA